MLRSDAAWLIEWYGEESPVRPGLPYARIEAAPYDLVFESEPFRLQEIARIEPALDHDEPVARLSGIDGGAWRLQRAVYSDGVKSNYAMDGPGRLREVLRAEYGAKLPPLGDPRLSNAIGTAVVVWDAAHRPYLPRRAPRQNAFPGKFHCTASGETLWSGACSFEGLFVENICRELEEEVGLHRGDLEWIRPVAFCREFLRGGKPQIFFAARTRLDTAELAARRRAAIARQIQRGRQEILDEVLEGYRPDLCTSECVANVELAVTFF